MRYDCVLRVCVRVRSGLIPETTPARGGPLDGGVAEHTVVCRYTIVSNAKSHTPITNRYKPLHKTRRTSRVPRTRYSTLLYNNRIVQLRAQL